MKHRNAGDSPPLFLSKSMSSRLRSTQTSPSQFIPNVRERRPKDTRYLPLRPLGSAFSHRSTAQHSLFAFVRQFPRVDDAIFEDLLNCSVVLRLDASRKAATSTNMSGQTSRRKYKEGVRESRLFLRPLGDQIMFGCGCVTK